MADPVPTPVPRTIFPGQICDCLELSDGVRTQRPGAAIQISATGAGTVTLELWNGGNEIIVNVAVGDSIYPYQVVKATAGTAVISKYYNLYQ